LSPINLRGCNSLYIACDGLSRGGSRRRGRRLPVVRINDAIHACQWVNQLFIYFRRGWVFRDKFTVIFKCSATDCLIRRFDGRLERIFRKVFPNGKLVISSSGSSLLNRRDVSKWIVSKDRVASYWVRGGRKRRRYRGNLGAFLNLLKSLSVKDVRRVRGVLWIQFTFYVSEFLLSMILELLPSGSKIALGISPSLYERETGFSKKFLRPRVIGNLPRFWSRQMRSWFFYQVQSNGLHFKDISMLIFRLFGYRVTAKRLAILFWLWWGLKPPPF
jgi:hypothetical protein